LVKQREENTMADPNYFEMLYGPDPWGDADDDDDNIVPDGGKLIVPITMMDGNGPGFVPRSAEDAARSEEAWIKRRLALQDRWRTPPPSRPRQQRDQQRRPQQPPPPTPTGHAAAMRAASDARYQQRCRALENAWRGGKP
jgi:hypothetical protein